MRASRWFRRFFPLLLALTLAAACVAPALAAEPGFVNFQNKTESYTQGQFSDVGEDWYTPYVAAVYELGLMQGGADGAFRPDDGVTLAEVCALAARLRRIWNGDSGELKQGTPWYQVYVDDCRTAGILTAEFADFTAPASRRDFAGLLSRALPESALPEINEIADGDIPDVAADDPEAEGIYRLYRAGVLTGSDGYGSFSPSSGIRRSEAAAIVSRLAFRSLRQLLSLMPKPAWPDVVETERLDDEWFADAAMLGNSLVDGMYLSSGIDTISYFGETGSTVYNNRIAQLLKKQYGKVYIQFGINEVGISTEEYVERYRRIVDRIQEAMPEADIYIMSLTPVTKAVSDKGTFTMKRIKTLNDALYNLAREEQCWYLDCCTPLCDDDGYLVKSYAGWDGSPHLANSGYRAWAEVLRTHAAPGTE